MASRTSSPHVLIVGGGLGGPALAQALRKHGISYDLFERDNSNTSRAQGWAVMLQSNSIKEFHAELPGDLPDINTVHHLYEHGISESEIGIYNIDNQLREISREHDTPERPLIRAGRAKLRRWLLTNVHVHWNKRFRHYEEDEDGVTAHFEDGTSYHGDVLVGADGIHSRVRNQLLRNAGIQPAPIAMGVILGQLTATREQYERWMKLGTSLSIGLASGGRVIVVALKDIAADQSSAEYYWIFGWGDPAASDEDYWTASASPEELHGYVTRHLDGVHESFAEVLRATPVDGMLHPPLRLRDMTPPELPRGRVTLLGDAVHPMTFFRGQGANMAMKDGFALARAIRALDGGPPEDALQAYEAEMRPRTTEMVLSSRNRWL